MGEQDQSYQLEFPVFISMVLNEHNLIDNRLCYYLKNLKNPIFLDETNKKSFLVSIDDIKYVINNYFKREINEFASYNKANIYRYVNSVYFLSKFIKTMPNLRFCKIDVSDRETYNRSHDEGGIIFDYSIVSSLIDLPAYLDDQGLVNLKSYFIEMGVVDGNSFDDTNYINISAKELTEILNFSIDSQPVDLEESEDEEMGKMDSVSFLSTLITDKLVVDNSNITVILEK